MSEHTKGSSWRKFYRFGVAYPVGCFVMVAALACFAMGDGNPFLGAVRFILESGTQYTATDKPGEYITRGCLDAPPKPATANELPATPPVVCQHFGSVRVTEAEIAYQIGWSVAVLYVMFVVLAWIAESIVSTIATVVRGYREGGQS
ncbi:hypothetical protein BLAT2472_170063 [Burkholderia latens]|uniref:hypothetical protein n=1 Tax=Burkholderia latens TaxID=488446 RepID=UPI0039A50284